MRPIVGIAGVANDCHEDFYGLQISVNTIHDSSFPYLPIVNAKS